MSIEESIEEKVKVYKTLTEKIEELEAQKKILAFDILNRMPQEAKSMYVADFQVRRIVRLNIKTSLEAAQSLDAVQWKEVVDKEKIKSLYELGHPVPDVTEIQYIQVSKRPVSAM